MNIKAETFLLETEKALQIVERKVREKTNEMSPQTKLITLDKLLVTVGDFYQQEELLKEKAQVEFEIKKAGTRPFIPVEVREKIEANREIETEALHKVMGGKYAELGKHLATLEQLLQTKVTPLLDEINSLHDREHSMLPLEKFLCATYGYQDQNNGELVADFMERAFASNERKIAANFKGTVEAFITESKGVKFK